MNDITNLASQADEETLPALSKAKYLLQYNKFDNWIKTKNCDNITEDAVLAYFKELSIKLSAATLWSVYSMLKATLALRNNIMINQFSRVICFLKAKSKGYTPKKSNTFSKENIDFFLENAPNDKYLAMKVSFLI